MPILSFFKLSWLSLKGRYLTSLLTVLAMTLSLLLLLGIRSSLRGIYSSFERSASGADLIVGPRSHPIQLLLNSVFHIGAPTNAIDQNSIEFLQHHPEIIRMVPIALGDSHRNYPVVATDLQMFSKISAESNHLSFQKGRPFSSDTFEAVLGAIIARDLGYSLGQNLTLSHGTGEVVFQEHSANPMTVVGILAPTGTPTDRAIFIPLHALAAMHADHPHPDTDHHNEHEHHHHHHHAHNPSTTPLSALFLKVKTKQSLLTIQRTINTYPDQPLTAIIPGATLRDLWLVFAAFDTALSTLATFVLIIVLLVIMAVMFSTLQERRREIAIYRSLGASSRSVFTFFLTEATILVALSTILSYIFLVAIYTGLGPYLLRYGVHLQSLTLFEISDLSIILGVWLSTWIVALIPAWQSYRDSLNDELSIRK